MFHLHENNKKQTESIATPNSSDFQQKGVASSMPPPFMAITNPMSQMKENGEGKMEVLQKKENNDGYYTAPKQFKQNKPFQLKDSSANQKSQGGLPQEVQAKMENSMGHDFSNVNIHENSRNATDAGALAYAQGNDIHFAPGQFKPDTTSGQELIGHELAHVVQQREGRVKPTKMLGKGMAVNDDPGLEKEADDMGRKAANFTGTTSSLKSKSTKGTSSYQFKSNVAQCNMVSVPGEDMNVSKGAFAINMIAVQSPTGKSGERGTVSFTPNANCPDTDSIQLVQVVKDFNLDVTPNADYTWTGDESDRMNLMTSSTVTPYTTVENDTLQTISQGHITPQEIYAANSTVLTSSVPTDVIAVGTNLTIPTVQGGYFIDHSAGSATATPRANEADGDVPLNYRSYWENSANSQNGSKDGTDIEEASLWDFPGSSGSREFSFETVARSQDRGMDFGTLHWNFRIKTDGTIDNENYHVEAGTSDTYEAAISEFNEHYGNHHIVVEGESLWELAKLYYQDPTKWTRIRDANGLTGSNIRRAQRLIIPDITHED